MSLTDAGWSSLVARRAHNPKVVGSNPAPATKSSVPVDGQGREASSPGLVLGLFVMAPPLGAIPKGLDTRPLFSFLEVLWPNSNVS